MTDAVNQQGSLLSQESITPQRLHAGRSRQLSKAYILGALHDGTVCKYTYRISQKYKKFVDAIAFAIRNMGGRAWVYREGKQRKLFIVEFSKTFLSGVKIETEQDKKDYIAGYFDAEGSVPIKEDARMYIYFAQKNKADLEEVRKYLLDLGIDCGEIHNPSVKVDPDYWRFFVRARSYKKFARMITSFHPRKGKVLEMVI